MDPGTIFFLSLIAFVAVGAIWFRIVRPAIEDYRELSRESAGDADVMSRAMEIDEATIAPSALRQTAPQTDQTAAPPPIPRDVMIDTLRSLREHGYSREQARALLRGLRQPLDNNLWTAAAPPERNDDEIVTPFAGRRTKASYYPDNPELEFEPPRA